VDAADLMDVGMLFQHRGPATEKARSLRQVFDFWTFRSLFTSDRRDRTFPENTRQHTTKHKNQCTYNGTTDCSSY